MILPVYAMYRQRAAGNPHISLKQSKTISDMSYFVIQELRYLMDLDFTKVIHTPNVASFHHLHSRHFVVKVGRLKLSTCSGKRITVDESVLKDYERWKMQENAIIAGVYSMVARPPRVPRRGSTQKRKLTVLQDSKQVNVDKRQKVPPSTTSAPTEQQIRDKTLLHGHRFDNLRRSFSPAIMSIGSATPSAFNGQGMQQGAVFVPQTTVIPAYLTPMRGDGGNMFDLAHARPINQQQCPAYQPSMYPPSPRKYDALVNEYSGGMQEFALPTHPHVRRHQEIPKTPHIPSAQSIRAHWHTPRGLAQHPVERSRLHVMATEPLPDNPPDSTGPRVSELSKTMHPFPDLQYMR